MTTPVIAPSGLSFSRNTGPTRSIDAFSDRFALRAPDTFATDTSSAYSSFVLSGTSSVAVGSGSAVFSGASAGGMALRAAEQGLAPYMYAEMTVSARTAGVTPFLGFGLDVNNYVYLYCTDTQVAVDAKIGGVGNLGGPPTSLTLTAPFTIRLVLCYPEAWIWVSDGDGDRPVYSCNVSGADLRMLTKFASGFRPLFGFDRPAGGSGTCTSFRTGYTGAIGLRDFKPITHLDGQPYQNGTKRYFMSTCATGGDFKTNHTSVLSIDLANSYAPKIESLLFFNIANSDRTNGSATKDMRTSLYGGQILRDDANNKWIVVTNGWGLGNQFTGIKLWYAETTTDLTSGDRVLALDARQLVISGATTAEYDNSQYFDGTNWQVCFGKTDAATDWITYYGAYATGPDLDSLTLQTTDTSRQAEGLNWCRIGGAWYASAGGANNWWDASFSHVTGPTLDFTGTNASFSNFGTHIPVIPIDTAGNTQYLMLMFDDSQLLSGNATKGGIVTLLSAETPSGTEFPAPTVTAASINTDGDTLTLTFSESVTGGTGFSLSGGATLGSAIGSGSSRTFSITPTVKQGQTRTLSYIPGDIADDADNAMEAFSGADVTNNSTVVAAASAIIAGGSKRFFPVLKKKKR